MRVEKRKGNIYGLQIEANRTKDDHELRGRDFANSDIDWSRTEDNVFLKRCDNWRETLTAAFKHFGVKERKDSVILLDGLYTASQDWFEGRPMSEVMDYFRDCMAFHERVYGPVLNAVIHFDEATPHLAVVSVPLVQNGDQVRLSAKEIMGGRSDYRKRQNMFYEEVTKSRGLERGEIKDPTEVKKHLTKREWQNQQLEAQNKKLQELNKAMQDTAHPLMVQKLMSDFVKRGKTRGQYGEMKYFDEMFAGYAYQEIDRLQGQGALQAMGIDADQFRQYVSQTFNVPMPQIDRVQEHDDGRGR